MEAKQTLGAFASDQMLGPPAPIQILKTGSGQGGTLAWKRVSIFHIHANVQKGNLGAHRIQ